MQKLSGFLWWKADMTSGPDCALDKWFPRKLKKRLWFTFTYSSLPPCFLLSVLMQDWLGVFWRATVTQGHFIQMSWWLCPALSALSLPSPWGTEDDGDKKLLPFCFPPWLWDRLWPQPQDLLQWVAALPSTEQENMSDRVNWLYTRSTSDSRLMVQGWVGALGQMG